MEDQKVNLVNRQSIKEEYQLLVRLEEYEIFKKELSTVEFKFKNHLGQTIYHNLSDYLSDNVMKEVQRDFMNHVLGEIDNQIDAIKELLNLED